MSEREKRLEAALRDVETIAERGKATIPFGSGPVAGAFRQITATVAAALEGGEGEAAAEPHPALCGAENGAARCSRVAGHPGFHIDGGTVWGTSSKGYPMDPERTLTIPPEGPAP